MDIKSTTPLSGLFRSSPFKPVQEHMRMVFSCICYLPPIMDALYRQDKAQIEEFGQHIIQLETEADAIKHTFRLSMPNTLLLPVDREDLLRLISDQDRLADTTEDIAKTLLFRDMEVPDPLKNVLDELLEGTMEISAAAIKRRVKIDSIVNTATVMNSTNSNTLSATLPFAAGSIMPIAIGISARANAPITVAVRTKG